MHANRALSALNIAKERELKYVRNLEQRQPACCKISGQWLEKFGATLYDPEMGPITVFISYSHDSEEHRDQVLALSERLRQDGIDARLDRHVNGTPEQGWPRWMLDQLDAAHFVLLVCTEPYYRRFRGHEAPGKGTGADWEGALITQEIYDSRSRTLKFVPVLLSDAAENCIPEPLRCATHYTLTSEDAYKSLYDFLLGQAGVEPGPIGSLRIKPRQHGAALTFGKACPPKAARQNISRITHFAEKLIGRETELKRLDQAWNDSAQHVLVIRGIGGEGKTSLVAEWANQLALRGYDGASYFDWSFYSQGTRDQSMASSDPFIAAALEFFGGDAGKQLANSGASGRDKATKLLEYVRKHRTLLMLDGLEPLQYPPGPLAGFLRDDAMTVLLKGLAQGNPGLCAVTTRVPVADLARWQDSTAPEWELEHLSETAGADLLQRLLEPQKPRNVHQVRSTTEERMEISRALKGHALTLRLLGGFIHRALRDVRRWREVDYSKADAQYKTNPNNPDARYGHAFKTIEAYENWLASGGPATLRQRAVLRLLGLFDRPASGTSLGALRAPPVIADLTEPLCGITDDEWNTTLSELEECGLVTQSKTDPIFLSALAPSLDAHPLLREYFSRQLRKHPEAWRAGHQRLYEHFCATTKKRDRPKLEELQPLYQAVAHGCQAGMQQEAFKVYHDRITRGQEEYAVNQLGAYGCDLGAVVCFFDLPWRHLWPGFTENRQSWLLNEAAFRLRALGRLTEALEPLRMGVEIDRKVAERAAVEQDRLPLLKAAICVSNLSELELTLGKVAAAVEDAEQSVTYADLSGDAFWKMGTRTAHADALHQAGRRAEAQAKFREAEAIQIKHQFPFTVTDTLLYSMQGFQYCDLLLNIPERAAWQCIMGRTGFQPAVSNIVPEMPQQAAILQTLSSTANATASRKNPHVRRVSSCNAVSKRATQSLEIAKGYNWLLSIALDHLTLGRAALYKAILASSSFDSCCSLLKHAVDALYSAGDMTQIPRGLLTRAWLRSLTGAYTGPNSAQSDLEEAWEIAERGLMPLFLADIRLHRARLFGRPNLEASGEKYPWESPDADLAAARALIEKHGYWRRKEELDDAEKAARSWPKPISPIFEKKQPMHKTVVEFDLVGYSTICDNLEQGLDVNTVAQLNQQIQSFIDEGLQAVNAPRDLTVMATTGDGAILVFDSAQDAHRFTESVHEATEAHNRARTQPLAKRVFRSGAATGDIVMQPRPGGGFDIAGTTIARAVRLEAKAQPGGLLVDEATYENLPEDQKRRYDAKTQVTGKRDEVFDAYPCQLDMNGPQDAAFFTNQPRKESPLETAKGSNRAPRQEVLARFRQLKPHQYAELTFLLEIPIGQRPPDTLNLDEKKGRFLQWADENHRLDVLLEVLHELTAAEGALSPK